MFSIDLLSRTPVYEQIIDQLESYVSKGILCPGDKIPSVRNMSVKLSVNPNTIQKAFSELDKRGIIYSVPGRGCFITDNAPATVNSRKREKLTDLCELIKELKTAGIEKDELIDAVCSIYDNKEVKS